MLEIFSPILEGEGKQGRRRREEDTENHEKNPRGRIPVGEDC